MNAIITQNSENLTLIMHFFGIQVQWIVQKTNS